MGELIYIFSIVLYVCMMIASLCLTVWLLVLMWKRIFAPTIKALRSK